MKVLIIGGVAGGATAAARLRRLDESAQIIMFERGDYISFANCGLPYYIGGEITDKGALTVQTPESFKSRLNIDVRVRETVTAINRKEKTLTVQKADGSIYTESYDKLLVTPGAAPVILPLEGMDAPNVFTLRNIPDTYKIDEFISRNKPKTAAIIGGGFIGLEMAENLKRRGLEVTVIEAAPQIAAVLDEDTVCDLQNYLVTQGITVKTNVKLNSIGETGCDMVLVSVGVKPESELAVSCGLETGIKGAIIVDENMRTSDPDIYAAGDAVQIKNFVTGGDGYVPLAGPANKQARIAADNIAGGNSTYKGTQGTSVLKVFGMAAAATGLNERAAKAAELPYDKVFLYSANHATYYPGAEFMNLKVIFDTTNGRILGAQAVGSGGVDKRIDVLATAIRGGMRASDLCDLELAYAPPFSSAKDPVNMAGYVIENLMTGKVKQIHWHQVDELTGTPGLQRIDVRPAEACAGGTIPGAVSMPLTELRNRLDELDKNRPVYVSCQTGLNSYIACRILTGLGFNAVNLAGGYRLYDSVRRSRGG